MHISAYVYIDQLKFCVVCVDSLGCVCFNAMSLLMSHCWFVFPVCAYGGAVMYFKLVVCLVL